jgi:hypothetical protein
MTRTTALRVWLAWTIANGLGGLIGFGTGGAIVSAGAATIDTISPNTGPRPLPIMLAAMALFVAWPLVIGASVGAGQWLALRWSVPTVLSVLRFWAWVRNQALLWLGGALAAGLALYAIEMMPGRRGADVMATIDALALGLLLGIVVGIGQLFMFGRLSQRAWIWPIAVPIAFVIGALVGAEAPNRVPDSLRTNDWLQYFVLMPAIAGLVGGTVSGALSGPALAWMLADPTDPTEFDETDDRRSSTG